VPFSLVDLAQHAGVSLENLEALSSDLRLTPERLYTRSPFRKRHGGIREVFKPKLRYAIVTKNLRRNFVDLLPYETPDHVHGFVRGRSTVSNASSHLGKSCVLRVDLEDFFPSISAAMVKSSLMACGYDDKASDLAVNIVTIAGKLPIGLSTSPFLSNLVFLATDNALADYASSKDLSFTRYVDDLTFSGEISDGHLADIELILDGAGWSVNSHKTAFMRRGGAQYVTGLYVGGSDQPRIPRQVKRRMRWILHIISKFGYDAYMADYGGEADEMQRGRLLGWACYIASVEPDLGFSLLRAFDELVPEGWWVRPGDYGEWE
jgi:RNA-directed DNA polymerase